jgi:hypothetical protein
MSRQFPFAFPAAVAIALTLGSCAAPTIVPPPARPVPLPAPAPAPRPQPSAAPLPADWRDWPLAPGTWNYRQDSRGSIALFGTAGQDAELTLRCDRTRSRIYLSRRGEGAGPLTIRTSSATRVVNAMPTGAAPAYLAVEFAVRDPLLDAIGYSRGRLAVEGAGLPPLAVPAWAELLRVVEDCR